MDYNLINTISNYLNYINTDLDKEMYNYDKFKEIINSIILGKENPLTLYGNLQSITSNNILESRNEYNIRFCIDYSTLIFCKFTKENLFECLEGENQKFYNYSIGNNEYVPFKIINELNKLGIIINPDTTTHIYEATSNKEIHAGMHFFLGLNDKTLLENYYKFGEKVILGISDPQLLSIPNFHIYHDTDLIFNNIFVNNIASSANPIVIKEILQIMSINEKQLDKFIGMSGNESIFDKLIKKFKKIEFAENNIEKLKDIDDLQMLNVSINVKSKNIVPVKYKESIDFLQQAKKIYITLKQQDKFNLQQFCSALDEICPGKLNIFDEEYQIEQFRETYGGKEFKEKFLNNLAKTAEGLAFSDIKKILNNEKIKPRIKLTIQEKLCEEVLNYNSNHKTKQIPILLLINDFKNLGNDDFKKLKQIINEYMNGNTKYLYDYLVRRENLDKIIEKIDIEKSDKKVSLDQKIEKATLDYEKEKQDKNQPNKEILDR